MTDAQEELRLEVVEEPEEQELAAQLRPALLSHPVVRARYPNADMWIVHVDELGKDDARPGAGVGDEGAGEFRAFLADMAGNDVAEAYGRLADPYSVSVASTPRPRLPAEEEHAWALGVLRDADADLARRIDRGEVEPYRPMPPLASAQAPDGSVQRAITVGLRERLPGGAVRHRVLAVRTDEGDVLDEGFGLPEPAERDCGAPEGPSCAAGSGAKRARVRLWRGEQRLWDLLVVRPSASSGVNGSGVELRSVDYVGQRVLHRAHVPILNVSYEDQRGRCGPTYRDWFNEEACFEADGDEPVAGFRVGAAAPRTILDTDRGGGNFRGVALYLDGEELVVLSQLQAGWYRYVSEWRLGAGGTIRPRVGFAAVSNPCTCSPHTHHAYWRLDFDILGNDPNLVQEFNEPNLPGQLAPWHTIRYEVARQRDPGYRRRWRVRSTRSPHGYTIVPGAHDGVADEFGAGDFWVLRYHGSELDDGQGFTTDPVESRAHLDRFLTGELVEREDVVVWYGAHFRHAPGEGRGHGVGPELEPFSWKPKGEREPYAPLVPPAVEAPDDEDWDGEEDEAGGDAEPSPAE